MSFDFVELVSLEGKSYLLSELLEKDHLNLILFYNNDCLGCTGRAIPLAYELQNEYSFLHLIVIHSSFGARNYSAEDIQSIFTSGEAPFPIYMESSHELYDYFDCNGTPHWVLMNEEGEILHSIFGSQEGSQMKLDFAIREFSEN